MKGNVKKGVTSLVRQRHKAAMKIFAKDEKCKTAILAWVADEINRECRNSSKDSHLRVKDVEDLEHFNFTELYKEVKYQCPTTHATLEAIARTKKDKKFKEYRVAVAYALLMNMRNNNMSMMQKLISIILYMGHTKTDVSILSNWFSMVSLSGKNEGGRGGGPPIWIVLEKSPPPCPPIKI